MNTKFILKASFNNSSFGEGKLFINDFDFKTILQLVESSLQDEFLTRNLYTVIGFGGPGQLHEPHTFTSQGDIFNQVDSIPETINR